MVCWWYDSVCLKGGVFFLSVSEYRLNSSYYLDVRCMIRGSLQILLPFATVDTGCKLYEKRLSSNLAASCHLSSAFRIPLSEWKFTEPKHGMNVEYTEGKHLSILTETLGKPTEYAVDPVIKRMRSTCISLLNIESFYRKRQNCIWYSLALSCTW